MDKRRYNGDAGLCGGRLWNGYGKWWFLL